MPITSLLSSVNFTRIFRIAYPAGDWCLRRLGCRVNYDRGAGVTQISWANAAFGDWSDPTNWNPQQVPGPGDEATITASGTAYTITISGPQAVGGVDLDAVGATLDVQNSGGT